MPPTSTRSVSATVPTGMPRSLAASRSTSTCTSGLRKESVVSRSRMPRLLLQLRNQLICIFGKLVEVRPGEIHLERLRSPASLERRNVVDADAEVGIVGQHLAGRLLNGTGVLAVVTSREVPPAAYQSVQLGHSHVDRGPGDVAFALDRPAPLGLADGREDVLGSLQLPDPIFQPLQKLAGALQAVPLGRGDGDLVLALVVARNQRQRPSPCRWERYWQ